MRGLSGPSGGLQVKPAGPVRGSDQRPGQHAGEPQLFGVFRISTNSSGLTQRSSGWWTSTDADIG